jgi:hypothetical protein
MKSLGVWDERLGASEFEGLTQDKLSKSSFGILSWA